MLAGERSMTRCSWALSRRRRAGGHRRRCSRGGRRRAGGSRRWPGRGHAGGPTRTARGWTRGAGRVPDEVTGMRADRRQAAAASWDRAELAVQTKTTWAGIGRWHRGAPRGMAATRGSSSRSWTYWRRRSPRTGRAGRCPPGRERRGGRPADWWPGRIGSRALRERRHRGRAGRRWQAGAARRGRHAGGRAARDRSCRHTLPRRRVESSMVEVCRDVNRRGVARPPRGAASLPARTARAAGDGCWPRESVPGCS